MIPSVLKTTLCTGLFNKAKKEHTTTKQSNEFKIERLNSILIKSDVNRVQLFKLCQFILPENVKKEQSINMQEHVLQVNAYFFQISTIRGKIFNIFIRCSYNINIANRKNVTIHKILRIKLT